VFAEFGVEHFINEIEADAAVASPFWLMPIAQTDTVPDGIGAPNSREVSLVDREDRIARAADLIMALFGVKIDEVGPASEECETPTQDFIPCP
jgi:hypothetical protein